MASVGLLGLGVVGIPFLTQMGIAAALTIVVAVLVALTLLPAIVGALGTRAFAGQPLGRPILGSNNSLRPVGREGIEGWRRALYAPERMVVTASGAVDEAELLALAELERLAADRQQPGDSPDLLASFIEWDLAVGG